jgi:hypothetical protein
LTERVPVAQDHVATIRKAAGAALRRRGFRTHDTRNWRRGDDVEGFVSVAWQGDKWNTKAQAEASLNVAVWPAGTREHVSELRGLEVEPFVAANAPLLGTGPNVTGDPSAGTYSVVADMDDDEIDEQVRRAESCVEAMAEWATPMLDARVSAPFMRDDNAVAALLARHPDWPDLDPTLDRLTAAFQRLPGPIELHPVIVRWRRERGLPEVPLPVWWRYASHLRGAGRYDSPRAELLAGIGVAVDFRFADGTRRPPRPEDLPDAEQIERWREESRRAPLPEGVLQELPEWLPYARWLEEAPAAPATPPPQRRLWRWGSDGSRT